MIDCEGNIFLLLKKSKQQFRKQKKNEDYVLHKEGTSNKNTHVFKKMNLLIIFSKIEQKKINQIISLDYFCYHNSNLLY